MFSDSSTIICNNCIQLNNLCDDCLEQRASYDADIAHEIVDERNLVYPKVWSSHKGLPSNHDWIAPVTRNADGTIREEFAPSTVDMIDRLFNLDESINLSAHEMVCSECHYVTNKHAVCPNCN